MKVWLVLLFTLLAVLILVETGEAKKRDRQHQADAADAGEIPEGGRHRGNRQRGKDKRGRKDREQNGEQTDAEVTGDADTPPADPEETNPDETQGLPEPEPEPQPETTPARRGHTGGVNPNKEARRLVKEARKQQQAAKALRKEGSSSRKEARKEAKRESKKSANAEKKQARKEARKMARAQNMTDCSEHSECPTGSCCQHRGSMQKCRAFDRSEGSKCFEDCVCAEGLECFIREGKQPRQPGGNVKGMCRRVAAEEPAANQEPGQNEE